MATTLRIAALQLRAHDRIHFEQAAPQLLERIAAAADGNDLLVVPEGTLPAYVLGDANVDVSATIERVRAIAQANACVIVIGAATSSERGLGNTAVVIDRDGSIAGSVDKIFLWHFDRKWFAPGVSIEPVKTSIGYLGVMICADGRMPGIARELVDRGAELLVMPTAWVTSGRDPANLENVQADLLARVRAFENGVPFVAANKCGIEEAMVAYCGKSQIIDSQGEVVALASQHDEESISATVAIGTSKPHRLPTHDPEPRKGSESAIRVVVTPFNVEIDIDRRLSILDADIAVGPREEGIGALDAFIPCIALGQEAAFDPGMLIPYRAHGYRCVVIETVTAHPWLERVARTRALELRMYVIVIEQDRRAYAIDPDGAIVCGTYGDLRMASFALDVRRTEQTLVAPGTDIAKGLADVAALARPSTGA